VPNPLAAHYSRFRVTERILLTGHSHQAWPDVAFEAQQRAWLDAAELVDDKWGRALEQAARVRAGFSRLIGDAPESIALAQNTHELVTRWLSALPFTTRRRIVTTSGEFHTIRRQLDRLAEEGLEIVKVPARPVEELSARLASEVDDRTLAVMVSSVLYETAEIVPDLDRVAQACERHGVPLLVDAYHHLNVVPFDLRAMGIESAFVTGGGYKYCQLGEGNCFLRVPSGTRLRPVLTGWFAEFEHVGEHPNAPHPTVSYGVGAAAFAGATYDPTSHYRAAAVFDFHIAQGADAGSSSSDQHASGAAAGTGRRNVRCGSGHVSGLGGAGASSRRISCDSIASCCRSGTSSAPARSICRLPRRHPASRAGSLRQRRTAPGGRHKVESRRHWGLTPIQRVTGV
jgi:kynureninase